MFRGWHASLPTPHFGHRRQRGRGGTEEREGEKKKSKNRKKAGEKEGRRRERNGEMTEEGREKKGGRKTGQPKSLMNWQIRSKVSGIFKGWRSSGGHRSHRK